MNLETLLFFFLAAVTLNMVLTPLLIRLAPRFRLLDKPGPRKSQTSPVPKVGGAAILLSILVAFGASLLLFPSEPFMGLAGQKGKLAVILVGTFLAALLGLSDDLFDLKPRWKFLGQAVLAVGFAVFGYQFGFLHLPGFSTWGLSFLAVPLTAFWIMAVINGFNFMDGVDGLAGAVTAITLAALAVASPLLGGHLIGVLSVTALGATVVFLAFNRHPAKAYLGDTGASAMGFFCAACLISLGQGGPAFFSPVFPELTREPYRFQFLVATLLVGYPFLEVLLSSARRGIKKFFFGRSMEWSEKEHIHHRLMKLGVKPALICCVGASFSLLMASAGVLAMVRQDALASFCLVPVLVVLAVLMPKMGFFDFLHPRSLSEKRPYYRMAHLFMEMQRVKLDLAEDRNDILALVCQSCAELGVQGLSLKLAGKDGNSFSFHWERPHDVQREYLNTMKSEISEGRFEVYRDKVALEGGRGEAFWIFEPHTVEDELDVEYRVLVGDFMRTALERVCASAPSPADDLLVRIDGLAHAKVRSSLLRRRFARKPTKPRMPSLN